MTDKIKDIHETVAIVREIREGLNIPKLQEFKASTSYNTSILKILESVMELAELTYDVEGGLIADLLDEYKRENALEETEGLRK